MPLSQSANIAIGLDLSALATSATFVSGIESTQIDNTTLNYLDALVTIKGVIGHATTAPVLGQMINVYVWGSDISLATTAIDTLDGVTSVEALSHVSVLNSLRFAGSAQVTVATAALTYYVLPFAVGPLFGGIMPKFWGIYVAHNHAGALGGTNNTLFSYAGSILT